MLRAFVWLLVVCACAHSASAQDSSALRPLVRPGEELVFSVRSERFGDIGSATMSVVEDSIAGQPAYRLSFDFQARVLLFNISDRTRSWLQRETLSTLRYTKDERSPLGRRQEDVTINPADSDWSTGGVRRLLASSEPLDELAFIYLVRGANQLDEPLELNRHFDVLRNPVHICTLGRESVLVMGQSREATVVQLDVPDNRQKGGRNRLRFYVSDDADRLILRIDSSMPVAGALVLTLTGVRQIHGSN